MLEKSSKRAHKDEITNKFVVIGTIFKDTVWLKNQR